MSRSDDPTRLVCAGLCGLVAAGLACPPAVAAAALLGRTAAMRVGLLAVAVAALLAGQARVSALEQRTLSPGHYAGTITITGQPLDGRAIASTSTGERVVVTLHGPALAQGQRYRVRGSLTDIDPVVRDYYSTQGVHLRLLVTDWLAAGRRGGVWGAVDRLHAGALAALGMGSNAGSERGLVAGIVIGDTSGLSEAERDRLRSSGLYHIVAVSGQNVALITLFVLVAFGLAGLIGTPARVAALFSAAVYTLVTGAGPSIVRAGAAGGLVATAWIASRPVLRWHLFACGAAIVLAVDPLELFDPGFQLSFAAVAAIYLVAPRLTGLLGQAAGVSVACTLVTTPIAWWHFGRLAPLAVPANLLALPAVAPILWLGVAAVLVGSVSPVLAAPLLGLADLLAGYVLWIARLFG
jgi:competence protein ComEC